MVKPLIDTKQHGVSFTQSHSSSVDLPGIKGLVISQYGGSLSLHVSDFPEVLAERIQQLISSLESGLEKLEKEIRE